MAKWLRHRFHANPIDPRPVIFPPPGPYWCSGYGGEAGKEFRYATLVAYLPPDVPVTDYWPEAEQITSEERDAIRFTDRFPRPEWYAGPCP
jgi:hypothetical protein